MTAVRLGYALPPGWNGGRLEYVDDAPRGVAAVPIRRPALDEEQAASLVEWLTRAGGPLRSTPVAEIADSLGRVGRRFLDSGDSIREEAAEWVASEAALSLAGAREVVSGMAREWTAERLHRTLRADFHDPAVLDGFVDAGDAGRVRAVGGRLALHICSGNVPGVGATSLVRSLLVKCPVLLKPGRTDVALAALFARALADVCEPLANAAAVLYWPRDGGGAAETEALAQAERVVVYGGNETIAELRRRTPVTTPLVGYHHRVSFAAIGRTAIESPEAARGTARSAAAAIGAYDARGCVSPRIFWIEEGAPVPPSDWATMLADELASLEARTPAGQVADGDAAELRQLADTVDLRRAGGQEVAMHHGRAFSWAVVYGPLDLAPQVSGGRVVLVCPIEGLAELPGRLASSPGPLQSAALAVATGRFERLSEALANAGVTRITSIDRIAWPPAWWRHDGQGPLLALVRWATLDS